MINTSLLSIVRKSVIVVYRGCMRLLLLLVKRFSPVLCAII